MNPGVLGARHPRHAQVIAPRRGWEDPGQRAPGGYGMLFGERMSGALIDDILSDAPDRVRALFVVGGNPALALPDARRAAHGLGSLDLLVTIDPFMTATARLSDYVIPPRMMLERFDVGSRDYETIVTFAPYGQYDAPVMPLPPGSEAVDDWRVLWGILQRLGPTVMLDGVAFDSATTPDSEDLIAFLLRDSAVPLAEIKAHAHGHIFPVPPMTVQPGDPANEARFTLAPGDILAEIAAVLAEDRAAAAGFTHRFAVRRMREVQNSMYHELPTIAARMPVNAAFVHPDDLIDHGLTEGDEINLSSTHGAARCIARADPGIRRGVVSMTHGWDAPGANVNAVTSGIAGRDPINAMPILTGFPVRIDRAI